MELSKENKNCKSMCSEVIGIQEVRRKLSLIKSNSNMKGPASGNPVLDLLTNRKMGGECGHLGCSPHKSSGSRGRLGR